MSTVAEFLRVKFNNMKMWLQAEGLGAQHAELHDLQIVALAQILHDDYAEAIESRSFAQLLEDKENLPRDVLTIVQHVEEHPLLHDKFWRYLKLFSDTVNTDE